MVKAAGPDRRHPAPPPTPPRPSRLRAALAFLPIVAGLLLLSGVIALGWLALQSLRGQERYRIAFNDIDCEPPPNTTREAFLDDVQFIAGFPDSAWRWTTACRPGCRRRSRVTRGSNGWRGSRWPGRDGCESAWCTARRCCA